MRGRIPSPELIRPHICALQALSAVAARPLIDPDLHRDAASKNACDVVRGRLSVDLLDWCDDFYGTLSTGTELARRIIPDTVWILPDSVVSRINWGRHEIGGCESPENVAVVCSVLNHVDFGFFDPERRHRWDAFKWIQHHVKRLASAVFHEFYECSEMFLTTLSRLYSHPHILDRHTLLITEALLSVGLPLHARQRIQELDQRYDAHLETIMTTAPSPVQRLSFAVKSGLLDYVLHGTDDRMVIENWRSLIVDACYACELPIFTYLWSHRSRLAGIGHTVYDNCARAALSVSNSSALAILLRDCDESMIGWDRATWAGELMPHTRSVACTDILLQYGRPQDDALFNCFDAGQLRYLKSCGVSVIPPSIDDAVTLLCTDADFACTLLDRWSEEKLPVMEYLCAAIKECTEAGDLRCLVRILDRTFESCQQRNECLSYAFLNHHMHHGVLFFKICLRLGVHVDVRDQVTGQTVLMRAARTGRDEMLRFFVTAGASVILRDNDGKTALDHYDARGYGHTDVREMLIHVMH